MLVYNLFDLTNFDITTNITQVTIGGLKAKIIIM